MTVNLPVNPETIYSELESIEALVTKWRKRMGQVLPGVDLAHAAAPGAVSPDEQLESILYEMSGELLLLAGKAQNLAVILLEK